jgi:thioredoxin 1
MVMRSMMGAMNSPLRGDSDAPTRLEVDAWRGPALLEFGAAWCGHCAAAQLAIAAALAMHPAVRHCKVADGPGLPLGRSYGVKLWPTLIFLRDGRELARLVRPRETAAIDTALQRLAASTD